MYSDIIKHHSLSYLLDIHQLSHQHDGNHNSVLHDIEFKVKKGQIYYLLGPSGCGKTTLLRLIAGLESLQKGKIIIGGRNSNCLPPHKRRIGLVFQDYALFPNMTARQNIAFGLQNQLFHWRINHWFNNCFKNQQLNNSSNRQSKTVLDAMVLRFGLDAVANHYPHQLSGGQQQRVSIARALISNPLLLLLDEPFSNLDSRAKDQTRDDILHLLHATQTSALIVSHDPQDALHMADQMTILTADGRVAQSGTPQEIYFSPNNAYVAQFMSEINKVPGHMTVQGFKTQFGVYHTYNMSDELRTRDRGIMIVRSEGMKLLPATNAHKLTPNLAQVMTARMLGNSSQIHLRTFTSDGAELHLHVREYGTYLPTVGSLYSLVIDPKMAHIFLD